MTRVMLAVLLWADAARGLMFQSHAVSSQWDTWAFVENGTYYVFYLVTEHSPGEGFGVATSPDGQHWDDRGYAFHGPSWTQHRWWEGTGSVRRAPDYTSTGRYLINWSQDPGRYQNITFGQSFDLIHWTPLDTYFDIDERYYNLPGRWDCIYTIPTPQARRAGPASGSMDGYPRYGFWTASPKQGMMGFGITHNGDCNPGCSPMQLMLQPSVPKLQLRLPRCPLGGAALTHDGAAAGWRDRGRRVHPLRPRPD